MIQEQHQLSSPGVCVPSFGTLDPLENPMNINCKPILDDLPIALRKGSRSCTKCPISHFVTTKNLSNRNPLCH